MNDLSDPTRSADTVVRVWIWRISIHARRRASALRVVRFIGSLRLLWRLAWDHGPCRPPLALAYKAVNTLDSMVGYKNDKYLRFGWASARFDDLVNWLPARLTGLLMVLAAPLFLRLQPLDLQAQPVRLEGLALGPQALHAGEQLLELARHVLDPGDLVRPPPVVGQARRRQAPLVAHVGIEIDRLIGVGEVLRLRVHGRVAGKVLRQKVPVRSAPPRNARGRVHADGSADRTGLQIGR